MPNPKKDELILAYIDNELDEETSRDIKDYIENNNEAKKIYEQIKKTKSYFLEAYEPIQKKEMPAHTENMIKNWNFKKKATILDKLIIFWKNPIPKYSLAPAIVVSFLAFVGLGQFAAIPLVNVAFMNADMKVSPSLGSKDLEEILNQKNIAVSNKDLNSLVNILNQKYNRAAKKTTMRGSNEVLKEIKFNNLSIIIKNTSEDNCISLEILSDNESNIETICKLDNNNWEFITNN